MCKQDRQGVRTASELIQRYKFGETFAEIMGLAKEAKDTADSASGSADELDAKLTHEEIFNRLTKNGELQGLYRGDDGELYVNASYLKSGIIDAAVVQVVNLIAERLKSTKDGQVLDIDGAGLVLSLDGVPLVVLNTNILMQCYLRMFYHNESGGENSELSLFGNLLQFYCDNTESTARIGMGHDGVPYAEFAKLNEKNIEWKDNGDGTFSLIGR